MKALTVILFLILAGIGFAQDSSYQTRNALIKYTGTGALWSDSLYNVLYVTTDTTYVGITVSEIDTLWEKPTSMFATNFLYDWMVITVQDTGTTYDDSLDLEYAVYTLNGGIITDTVWQKVQFMRDSSWTNVNGTFIVDDASVKSYTVFIGSYDLIRVSMTNVEAVTNRIARFWATLSKKYSR